MPEKKRLRVYNTMQQLMAGRLYGSLDAGGLNPPPGSYDTERLSEMNTQLIAAGGPAQQSRMIRDKRKSLNRALLYSYQSAFIKKVPQEGEEPDDSVPEVARALINPNKLKMDYDDKILSVGFEYNFKQGDIFEWLNTASYWIVRLQDLDELAYFRGEIRRCDYQIAWEDESGKQHKTYAAIRGPAETKINHTQKHQISIDNPNYTLNIYLPKNKATLEYFRRYAKFYLQGIEDGEENICWRVQAVDTISTPGIIEIAAMEYYSNTVEDDLENKVAGALVIKPIEVEEQHKDDEIQGNIFIKPKTVMEYVYTGNATADWTYDIKLPLATKIEGKKIKLKWLSNYSGQFDLYYGDCKKTIVIESLF